MTIVLAGCSSAPSPRPTHAAGAHITVAIVPRLLGDAQFDANIRGAKRVAAKLRETINYTASVRASGADQARVIRGLIAGKNPPDVIAFSANDPVSIVPALEAARRKGIAVIGFDSDVTPSTARSYFIQDTAYAEMGKALVDAVVARGGPTGSYAILSSTPDATVQNAWISAMKSYARASFPELTLQDIGYGESNQATSETQASAIIHDHPNLSVIVPIDGVAVPAALAAVKREGATGRVSVVGIGDPSPNAQYFADGSLTGLFLWDEVKQGELIAYLARGVADHTIAGSTPTFEAGELGAFTVQNDPVPGTIIFSQPLEFTRANYAQYDF